MGFMRLSDAFYCRWNDGAPDGFTREEAAFAYELVRHAGYERTLQYDREEPPTTDAWLEYLFGNGHMVFGMYRADGTPLAVGWLEPCSHTDRQRFGHFTTLSTGSRAECVEVVRRTLRFVGQATAIEQLIGVTPKCLRHAVRFARDVGFIPVATLRRAVFCLGRERDAVLSVNDIKALEA